MCVPAQRVSAETSSKVQLQLVLHSGAQVKFHFTADNALDQRQQVCINRYVSSPSLVNRYVSSPSLVTLQCKFKRMVLIRCRVQGKQNNNIVPSVEVMVSIEI